MSREAATLLWRNFLRCGRTAPFVALVCLCLLVTTTLLVAAPCHAAEPKDEKLGWVTPERAYLLPFSLEKAASGERTDADPSAPILLTPGNILFMPVEPGERVHVKGAVSALGFASGVREFPDVITWLPLTQPNVDKSRFEDVPSWSSTRFLVVRADKPTQVTLYKWGIPRTAMRWHRLDEDVVRYIRGKKASPPKETLPDAQATLRYIVAAKDLLGDTEGAPDWLTIRWLEETLKDRPLVEPFFTQKPLGLNGGNEAGKVDAIYQDPELSKPRFLSAQSDNGNRQARTLLIDAKDADVVRLVVQARGAGTTHAVVRVGDFLTRELRWAVAHRTSDEDRWTDVQTLRIPLTTGTRKVTVEVDQGELVVAAAAFRKRADLLDLYARERDRSLRANQLELLRATSSTTNLLQLAGLADHLAQAEQAKQTVLAAEKSTIPAPVRGLLLGEAVRWTRTAEETLLIAQQAIRAIAAVPADKKPPICRQLLERVLARAADRKAVLPVCFDLKSKQGDPDDRAALAALTAALTEVADGARPVHAVQASRHASEHPEDRSAATRARQTWLREGRWAPLAPPEDATIWKEIYEPLDAVGSTQCSLVGPQGMRWTLLREGRTVVDIAPLSARLSNSDASQKSGSDASGAKTPAATHHRVLIMPGQTEPMPETSLLVDGLPIAAHTGAGLATNIAITPGAHVFERQKDAAPLLARFPREGVAPCSSLREITRWTQPTGTARFVVPNPGVATVARVVVFPEKKTPNKVRIIRIHVARSTYEAWVLGDASGAIEVPVESDVGEIAVDAPNDTRIRASARLHPNPKPEPQVRAGVFLSPEEREDTLSELRKVVRTLETATGEARERALTRRADLLKKLNVPALSVLTASEDEKPEAIETEAAPAQALAMPQGAASIIPLDIVSKIPPLPLPTNLEPLKKARLALDRGDARAALALLDEGKAGESTSADGLLYAVRLERTGAGFLATSHFERIGLAHRSGAALAHAASLFADRAVEENNRAYAMRSFVLAQLASELFDPASNAFARLAPAIGWLSVARADSAAGTGLVDIRAGNGPMLPGVAARRALLDASESALLLSEGQHVEVRLKKSQPQTISVDTNCLALEPNTLCRLVVLLDGEEQAACGKSEDVITSSRMRCSVDVPKGSHRLEVRPPRNRTVIGTADFSKDGGFALPARVVSEWFEIDAERPLELMFAAPTVVRIEARGPANEARTLRYQITSAGKGSRAEPRRGELVLDSTKDENASLVGGAPSTLLPLGKELSTRIGVLSEGPHTLTVASPQGRTVVKVELAVAVGLPRERKRVEVKPQTPRRVESDQVLKPADDFPVAKVPSGVLLSLYSRFQNFDVEDEDGLTGSIQFGELGVRANRAIETIGGYASLSGFGRARDGMPSFGVAGTFDLSPNGFLPGVFFRGRFVAQPLLQSGFVKSPRGTAGVLWNIPLGDSASLVPWGSFSLLSTQSPVRDERKEIDREIWTQYTGAHERFASLGLRSVFRLTVDGIASVGVSARSNPAFSGLDRVELESKLQLLPGRGLWPWITLTGNTGYRPNGYDLSPDSPMFVRTWLEMRLAVWQWLVGGHRFMGGGEIRGLWDFVPDQQARDENSPFRLSGAIFFEYNYAGGRGLRDLPPRDAPFRARLEEGSGRIDWRATAADPLGITQP